MTKDRWPSTVLMSYLQYLRYRVGECTAQGEVQAPGLKTKKRAFDLQLKSIRITFSYLERNGVAVEKNTAAVLTESQSSQLLREHTSRTLP